MKEDWDDLTATIGSLCCVYLQSSVIDVEATGALGTSKRQCWDQGAFVCKRSGGAGLNEASGTQLKWSEGAAAGEWGVGSADTLRRAAKDGLDRPLESLACTPPGCTLPDRPRRAMALCSVRAYVRRRQGRPWAADGSESDGRGSQ